MTTKQRNMLFGEWSQCWAEITRKNGTASGADERTARLAITHKALGRPVASWSDINDQKDIDWLLVVMFGISRSGDFGAQMRQVNQPVTRMECSAWAQWLMEEIGIDQAGREAYVDGICRRIHKVPLLDLKTDKQWRAVLAALNHTRMHKKGIAHTHPRSLWQRRGGKAVRPSGAGQDHAGQNTASHVPATGSSSRTGSVTPAGDDENPY